MKRQVLFLVAILAVAGISCAPRLMQERVRELAVAPALIADTLHAELRDTPDTVVVAERIVRRDTLVRVRYYPKRKIVTLRVQPDTVRVLLRDTVIARSESGRTFAEDAKMAAVGFVLAALVIAAILFLAKR